MGCENLESEEYGKKNWSVGKKIGVWGKNSGVMSLESESWLVALTFWFNG